MPSTGISPSTLASSKVVAASYSAMYLFSVPVAKAVSGTNVVAVEVGGPVGRQRCGRAGQSMSRLGMPLILENKQAYHALLMSVGTVPRIHGGHPVSE